MQWDEIADFARTLTVMVRVQGPDPKGVKMRRHAFHQYHSGKTSLSSSGILLPGDIRVCTVDKQRGMQNSRFVITVASVVEPFLLAKCRDEVFQGEPELIYGASIDLMIEGRKRTMADGDESDADDVLWIPAQLFSLISIPNSALALESLFGGSLGTPESVWEVGWSLASYDKDSLQKTPMDSINHQVIQVPKEDKFFADDQKPFPLGKYGNTGLSANSATRLAIIRVLMNCDHLPQMFLSSSIKRGNFILAAGSPFGILSPAHFFNSVSVGSIANIYPSGSSETSLLMADIRCLPGMEGAPVFGEDAHLVGVLIRPLKQKSSGAEVQLVIPWEAIATACPELFQKRSHVSVERMQQINDLKIISAGMIFPFDHRIPVPSQSLSPSIEKAISSICLVTNGDGMWASGIVINENGLILTNAHFLEPWRFGKTSGNIGNMFSGKNLEIAYEAETNVCEGEDSAYTSALRMNDNLGFGDRGYGRIHVRLDNRGPWIWCGAKVVHVSKGPLDIALLQLDSLPKQLRPITMDFTHPIPGSKVYVIGHGIFGPQNGIFASVCCGVVAKVVSVRGEMKDKNMDERVRIPAMVETTAVVHPGGSGGGVLNSEGHMIGLVTSNARHGGGTVIPHLNFSIPCSALLPLLRFAQDEREVDESNSNWEQLGSVWALHNKQEFELESEEKAVKAGGKGSRFANFFSDNHMGEFPPFKTTLLHPPISRM